MKTVDFKTRTEFLHRENPSREGFWVIGLDIGYSAIKLMSPNKLAAFPAYARKVSADQITLKEPSPTDIRYRDRDGVWVIGNLAYEDVNASKVVESETELFNRKRYYSPMFKVNLRAGLAIALMANSYGSPKDKKIRVQTGLPPKYEKADTKDIKKVMSGRHEFELSIGKSPWQKFDFTLSENDIFVMPQPLGALVSASMSRNGRQVPDASRFFSSNVVIFDPGCGTCDDYAVKMGRVIDYDTHPELGMHEVFRRTCSDIYGEFDREIQVPELQNYLEKGQVRVMDTTGPRSKRTTCSFENILYHNSKQVCSEAIEKMNQRHNFFSDTDIIIATGGTYDAWADMFNDIFSEMDDLQIIPGNVNDTSLSNIYSNVRGYYFYLLNSKALR